MMPGEKTVVAGKQLVADKPVAADKSVIVNNAEMDNRRRNLNLYKFIIL